MIKVNELRVGNYVNHKNGFRKITLSHFKYGFAFFEKMVNPVPITKDILLRFGFEIKDSTVAEYYHIGTNKVTMDWLFDICWIDGYEYPFYKNGGHEIKTVHQLQNLYFFLTGEELVLN